MIETLTTTELIHELRSRCDTMFLTLRPKVTDPDNPHRMRTCWEGHSYYEAIGLVELAKAMAIQEHLEAFEDSK